MKILLVNDYGYPLGGAESYVFALRDGLISRGHSVLLGSSDRLLTGREELSSDFRLAHSGHFFNLDSYFNFKSMEQFRGVLKNEKPDLVHFHNLFYTLSPSILFGLGNVPAVMTLHDYFAICARDKTLPDGTLCTSAFGGACRTNHCVRGLEYVGEVVRRRIGFSGLRHVKKFIAPSEFLKNEFERNGIANVEVVSHPVSLSDKQPEYSGGKESVLYLGRLVSQKGLSSLLEAFSIVVAQIPDAELRIAGSGPQEASLKNLVRELGIEKQVHFLGWLGEDEKREAICSSLCVVLPSVWPEVAGLSMYEAAAYGIPAIASAIGGIPEFVRDRDTGLLFGPGDANDLARKLLYAFGHPDEMREFGIRARRRAEFLSYDEHLRHLEKFIGMSWFGDEERRGSLGRSVVMNDGHAAIHDTTRAVSRCPRGFRVWQEKSSTGLQRTHRPGIRRH